MISLLISLALLFHVYTTWFKLYGEEARLDYVFHQLADLEKLLHKFARELGYEIVADPDYGKDVGEYLIIKSEDNQEESK